MPHIHEKIDFTADVFVVFKDKVLLRMHEKHKMWLAVGGHIELDETPDQAAIREVKEEVGLEVILVPPREMSIEINDKRFTELVPPWYTNVHQVNDAHKHVSLVYFATSEIDVLVDSVSHHERAESRWVSRGELDTIKLLPNIYFYATEALKALSK